MISGAFASKIAKILLRMKFKVGAAAVCTENSEANRVRKKHNRAIIAADVRRFAYLINTDEVFGTHRPSKVCRSMAVTDSGLLASTASNA